MNDAQRAVLQKHHVDLARDLIVTPVLLGECFQNKLFDNHLIDIIKNDQSPSHKLLHLLPTRGPDAFDTFLKIIDTEYPWLVTLLQDSLEKELAKPVPNTPRLGITLPRLDSVDGGTINSPRFPSVSQTDEEEGSSDIRNRVTTFMNRHFGLSRKLSQADKRAIEQFIWDQGKIEQQKQRTLSLSSPTTEDENLENSDLFEKSENVKKKLFDCYIKIRVHMKAATPQTLQEGEKDEENSYVGLTEANMSFDLLQLQIDAALNRLTKLEDQISQCYDSLNDTEESEPLSKHIDRLVIQCQSNEQLLENERQKMEKMTEEFYLLTMQKKKVTQKMQLKEVELEVKQNQLNNLQKDMQELQKENDQLQRLHTHHLEKEKTLANLKEMIASLKESQHNMADENANLKSKLSAVEQTSPRSPRRQSSVLSKNTRFNINRTRTQQQPTRRKPISNFGSYRVNQP